MRLIRVYEGQNETVAPSEASSAKQSKSVPLVGERTERPAGAAATSPFTRPRGIARVPTHTVGRARERRSYVRANLKLPLFVRTVGGRPAPGMAALCTQDISSSGIFFLSPRRIEPGTPIEMEVVLVDKPSGQGTVRMCTQACVVRAEASGTPGWHGLAAAFDDITFIRDETFPAA
jgi:hypothetical protein